MVPSPKIGPARFVVVVAAASLLVTACASSPSASPATPIPEPPSEPPSPSEAAACGAPPTVCDGPLGAGTYVSEGTGARIEFTLEEHDWSGLADTQDVGFGLFPSDVGDGYISVARFAGEIFTEACDPNASSTMGTPPAEFMAFLAERTGVTASPPVELEVGGRPALQVDLTTVVDEACFATGGGRIWLWVLPVFGDFHFNDAETARVIAVDAGSATVIIVIEAFPDADYDHLLEHATELVDSMTITPL